MNTLRKRYKIVPIGKQNPVFAESDQLVGLYSRIIFDIDDKHLREVLDTKLSKRMSLEDAMKILIKLEK